MSWLVVSGDVTTQRHNQQQPKMSFFESRCCNFVIPFGEEKVGGILVHILTGPDLNPSLD